MFRLPILLLLALLLVGAPATAQQPGYRIQGQLTQLPAAGTRAYLRLHDRPVDSAAIVNGKFTLTGRVSEPNLYTVGVRGVAGEVEVVLDNRPISISGSAQDLEGAWVRGSALTTAYRHYQTDYLTPLDDKLRNELIANTKLAQQLRAKGDSAAAMQYIRRNGQLMAQRPRYVASYIRQHPAAFHSLLLLSRGWQSYGGALATDSMLRSLTPELRRHSLARQLATELASVRLPKGIDAVGKPAPEFVLPDTSHAPVRLSAYRGQYVLVDFWASWCGPCRGENPNLVAAYQRYHPKGLAIISVSLDDNARKWQTAIRQDNLPWTQVSDLQGWRNQVAAWYQVLQLPTNFLLDREGTIVARDLRGAALDAKLQELLP
ncbi:AhpC/TSA family protein [Hymenobacter sp. 15J16-1T3B]|uniref:TlpA disulfide reductase family protein n=1 Tax=Hymenobacter sp. 15J16-1T3B TaxID=2886941 RepID=UPI001D0FADFF|nr:TlpA disulfide reductase family protein [Hymenobacter sp. 15J16-1T3B]MCC3156356.1 AhpC/TSA family protein [Hymenobacter sp. 15J16-1T3B]